MRKRVSLERVEPPAVIDVPGGVEIVEERERHYLQCSVCGWTVDL